MKVKVNTPTEETPTPSDKNSNKPNIPPPSRAEHGGVGSKNENMKLNAKMPAEK